MTKLCSVKFTRWAFYEALNAKDRELMADYFETLYIHYQERGKKIRQARLRK